MSGSRPVFGMAPEMCISVHYCSYSETMGMVPLVGIEPLWVDGQRESAKLNKYDLSMEKGYLMLLC